MTRWLRWRRPRGPARSSQRPRPSIWRSFGRSCLASRAATTSATLRRRCASVAAPQSDWQLLRRRHRLHPAGRACSSRGRMLVVHAGPTCSRSGVGAYCSLKRAGSARSPAHGPP